MNTEIESIKERYDERKKNEHLLKGYSGKIFIENISKERENVYKKIIKQNFLHISEIKLLEIGAGNGNNLQFFINLGISSQNIFANELLSDRVEQLRKNVPTINILPGNALDLTFKNEFDIVFQSTVFTSILKNDFRMQLADKMWEMTKPNGIILWYDFIFSNPFATYIRKVSRKEIVALFSKSNNIKFYRVTLAPPISTRIGKLYTIINTLFPFLRTHVVSVIQKK